MAGEVGAEHVGAITIVASSWTRSIRLGIVGAACCAAGTLTIAAMQGMEWQPGGMVWALDNWMYSPYNPFRLRNAADGKVVREETDVIGGQWGTNQDNCGKAWFVDGGTEIGPVNFQTPIVYGAFNVPDNLEPDFQVPWPAPGGLADMQGGMNRVRLPDGTLNHFTAAAGLEINRGDRLPSDLVGDLLFEEPVGRMVRRAKVIVTEGLTQLRNAYPKSEFVRSTDPLFRPGNISNAPDGTLYLSDMYTGIIQGAQFVGPGSYLRRKVEQCPATPCSGTPTSAMRSVTSTRGATTPACCTSALRPIARRTRAYLPKQKHAFSGGAFGAGLCGNGLRSRLHGAGDGEGSDRSRARPDEFLTGGST